MKRMWLTLIFLIVLTSTLIANIPLRVVLDRAGLQDMGFNWQRAEGTVFGGKVSGAVFASQPLGTLSAVLRPRDLLRGKLGYAVTFEGAAVSGAANLSVTNGQAHVSGLNAKAKINQLVYLASELRNAGGEIQLTDTDIDLNLSKSECRTATGRVSSDMLDRLARRVADQEASEFSGDIACVSGALTLLMQGRINETDLVTLDGVLSARDRSRIEVTVRTLDGVLGAGLDLYGFEQNGETYIMRQEVVTLGGLFNG